MEGSPICSMAFLWNRGLREMLNAGRLHKPMFTLRGGTNEVLRGVIARGMGLR